MAAHNENQSSSTGPTNFPVLASKPEDKDENIKRLEERNRELEAAKMAAENQVQSLTRTNRWLKNKLRLQKRHLVLRAAENERLEICARHTEQYKQETGLLRQELETTRNRAHALMEVFHAQPSEQLLKFLESEEELHKMCGHLLDVTLASEKVELRNQALKERVSELEAARISPDARQRTEGLGNRKAEQQEIMAASNHDDSGMQEVFNELWDEHGTLHEARQRLEKVLENKTHKITEQEAKLEEQEMKFQEQRAKLERKATLENMRDHIQRLEEAYGKYRRKALQRFKSLEQVIRKEEDLERAKRVAEDYEKYLNQKNEKLKQELTAAGRTIEEKDMIITGKNEIIDEMAEAMRNNQPIKKGFLWIKTHVFRVKEDHIVETPLN